MFFGLCSIGIFLTVNSPIVTFLGEKENLFNNLQANEWKNKAKSNSSNPNQYNYMLGNLMKKIDHPNYDYSC